jgi:hypothetical protein
MELIRLINEDSSPQEKWWRERRRTSVPENLGARSSRLANADYKADRDLWEPQDACLRFMRQFSAQSITSIEFSLGFKSESAFGMRSSE